MFLRDGGSRACVSRRRRAKGTKEKEGEECDLGRKLPLLSLVVSKQGANTSLKERAPNVGLAPLRDTRTPHNRLPRFRWALLSLSLSLSPPLITRLFIARPLEYATCRLSRLCNFQNEKENSKEKKRNGRRNVLSLLRQKVNKRSLFARCLRIYLTYLFINYSIKW